MYSSFIVSVSNDAKSIIKLSKEVEEMIFTNNDKSFVEIKSAACSYGKVKKLDMLNSNIVLINRNAFEFCRNLEEVIFPSTLTTIESNCFVSTKIHNIHIPKNLINISESAFNQIAELQSFSVDSENEQFSEAKGCLYNHNKTKLIRATNKIHLTSEIPFFNSLESIGGFAFTSVPLTSFIAPKSLSSIESYSFHVTLSLNIIDLTYSRIKFIPMNAFYSTNALIIKCPLILEEIESFACHESKYLKTFIIYQNLQKLSESSFFNCTSLQKIIFYGVKDFSSIQAFDVTTPQNQIHVYVTRFYQYEQFGLIPVELLRRKTCDSFNFHFFSFSALFFSFFIITF